MNKYSIKRAAMKLHDNFRTFKNSKSKGSSRVIYSTTNSGIGTRVASPSSTHTVPSLKQKISRLKQKLSQAQEALLQSEKERQVEKQTQKEFLKMYHLKIFRLQENIDRKENLTDIDEKVIQERNALEVIWQRRYDEMKKYYETKIKTIQKSDNLCVKCKKFVLANDELNRKLNAYKLLEDR